MTNYGIQFIRIDRIALAVVTLAFTTIRRISSFLPKNVKVSETFSWILPRFIRESIEGTTMLVWIPRVKTDPEGRGTVLTVKSTGDAGCPIRFMQSLLREKLTDEPLFCYRSFIPTQQWLLTWIRARMTDLDKNPLWYSQRSIRQGASTKACELKMPEIFLRASGGWKGDAMEVYRKDRLPTEQARFASKLSQKEVVYKNRLRKDPTDLSGPFGTGGGQLGNFNSPPPFYTAIGVLAGEGHHAESRALREREVPLPEVSGSHNLSRPHLNRKIVVQEDPEWPLMVV